MGKQTTLSSLKTKQFILENTSVYFLEKNLNIFSSSREKRAGNNLYQELSFQEPDALGEIDEGADLTGATKIQKYVQTRFRNMCKRYSEICANEIKKYVQTRFTNMFKRDSKIFGRIIW